MSEFKQAGIRVRFKVLKYFLPLGLAVLLLLAGGTVISRCDFFLSNPSGNVITLGLTALKFEEKRVDADILVVGDSTALFGVVPSVLERETGLKAHNLGLTVFAFIYGEPLLLKHYLERNKPPKYIVLHINPWTRPGSELASPDSRYEEGFVTMRYGSVQDMVRFLRNKPREILYFPLHTLNTVGQYLLAGAEPSTLYREMCSQLSSYSGFLEMNLLGSHVDTTPYDCEAESPPVEPDREYIADFVKRYSSPQTRVLVLMAPLPECQKRLPHFQKVYAGVADRPPVGLPLHYFAPGTTSAHLRRSGAMQNSLQIGQLIRELDRPPQAAAGGSGQSGVGP